METWDVQYSCKQLGTGGGSGVYYRDYCHPVMPHGTARAPVMPHCTTTRAVNPPHNRTGGTYGKRAVGFFFFTKYTSKIEMSSKKNAGF